MDIKGLAMMVTEDAADTYMVMRESSGLLWHRRQRAGTRFDDATPLDVVLDFMKERGRISRYDLQSFLDHLQAVIVQQTDEMRQTAHQAIVDMFYGPEGAGPDPNGPDGGGGPADEDIEAVDGQLGQLSEIILGIVPVIRRSQAQARSAKHAVELLERHTDRLTAMVGDIQAAAPESVQGALDSMHYVVGGLLQAADIIKSEVIPLLWSKGR